jgi:N-dimethylarginine dimethylaminohydrolase
MVLPHLMPHPIIMANTKDEERRPETIVGSDFLNQMGFGSVTVAPAHWDGEADLKYLRDNIYFMVQGPGTTPLALDWFRQQFEMEIIPIQVHDPEFHHLEHIIFPLTTIQVIVNTGAISADDLVAIEKVAEVIPLNPMTRSATQLLRIHRLLLGSSNIATLKAGDDGYEVERTKVDAITRIAADNYFEPIFFNLSEYTDDGAGLGSLFLHLNTVDFAPGHL